jgi:hypothetical protein
VEGLEKARRRTARLGKAGLGALEEALPVGPDRDKLLGLATLMWKRDR